MPSYPIVGSNFYPPARGILAGIPAGIELELIPEPDNPNDENAIMVWICGTKIPEQNLKELNSLVSGFGFTAEEIKSNSWQLGYIARNFAAFLAPFSAQTGKFTTDFAGNPKVELGI